MSLARAGSGHQAEGKFSLGRFARHTSLAAGQEDLLQLAVDQLWLPLLLLLLRLGLLPEGGRGCRPEQKKRAVPKKNNQWP